MFGFYEIQLPRRLRDRLDNISRKQQGGSWLGVTLMGMISALVVSPCVSAPLAGALLYISSTGDAVLGGIALFALSMGMGAPLIAIGTTGAKLLPKAGGWMEKVKQIFGLVLLAVALWLIQRVLNETLTLLLWSLLFIASGIHLGALQNPSSGWQRAIQSIGLMLMLWGVFVLTGAATGKGSLETPLKGLSFGSNAGSGAGESAAMTESTLFTRITGDLELGAILRSGKPVVLDMYADWCISCKLMEDEIFAQSSVRALASAFHFVQLDVTEFSTEHKAILDRYGLAGPPAVLFFDQQGNEITAARIAGEADLAEFMTSVAVAKTADKRRAAATGQAD
jgi:thiol:disulfide interchange protein DsbD